MKQEKTLMYVSYSEFDSLVTRATDEGWTELALVGPTFPISDFAGNWPAELKNFEHVFKLREEVQELTARLLGLTSLTSLYLRANHIGDEGAITIAKYLVGLTSLNLANTSISEEGAAAIADSLVGLTSLDLANNSLGDGGIKAIATFLTNLKSLSLAGNRLSAQGSEVIAASLTNLTSLDLANNAVRDEGAKAIAASISGLTKLSLISNCIGNEGANAIGASLRQLIFLDLEGNHIGDEGAKGIVGLSGITKLRLAHNQIRNVPKGLIHHRSLKELTLYGNRLLGIDAEIYDDLDGQRALQSVRDYSRGLARGGIKHNEVKLLLVGNGRVGKTSIVNRLVDDGFDENEEPTHGIHIRRWSLEGVAPDRLDDEPVTVNIWDLAGQDIYHATHRLFMRTRAVFLLVWDRVTEGQRFSWDKKTKNHYENFELSYWIDYIRALSGSPVIVVQNKVDQARDKLRTYGADLQKIYPPPNGIIDYHHVSARKCHDSGLAALQESIREALSQLESVGYVLPAQWVYVRDQLLGLKERYIDFDQFLDICHSVGLKDSEPQSLADFLHQAGLLFYQPDSFDNRLILDQQWAIRGVYAVLDYRSEHDSYLRLAAKEGLTLDQLKATAWQEFTSEEHSLLLEFMKSCEICFEYLTGVYYVPQLLPERRPESVAKRWLGTTDFCLQIRYAFLHRAIIERFIVRVGQHTEDLYPELWKNGIVVLHQPSDTMAMVEAFPDERRILVQAKGPASVSLLQMIRNEFDELHEGFAPEISFSCDAGKHFVSEIAVRQFSEAEAMKVPTIDDCLVEITPFRAFLNSGSAKLPDASVRPTLVADEQIFLSYAWGDPGESTESREAIVDHLYDAMLQRGLKVIRDKKDNGYRKIISSFMRRIGEGRLVVVVISDKYLRSPYCMWELLEIYKNGSFHDRVFPIMLGDVRLHSEDMRLAYVKDWQNEEIEARKRIDNIGLDRVSIDGAVEKYYSYQLPISRMIDQLTALVADWNTLTPQALAKDDFAILLDEIEVRLANLDDGRLDSIQKQS